MVRNRSSAKKAGTRFEGLVSSYLRDALGLDAIERRARSGSNDRGDINGVKCHLGRVVIECKDCTRTELPNWLRQAEIERDNDGASIGVVVHKRKGVAVPENQYVTMTLETFARLLRTDDAQPDGVEVNHGERLHERSERGG